MVSERYDIIPYGEEAVLVSFEETPAPAAQRRAAALSRLLAEEPFPGYVEHVPSTRSVCVYFDMMLVPAATSKLPHEEVAAHLRRLLLRSERPEAMNEIAARDVIRIPICYCPACGPDLAALAAERGMTAEEAVNLHSSVMYTVAMIGFLPGFPYMSGLPEVLAAERLDTPRASVPAGSVGIAGRQTGIYPSASPGGWRLIGRTNSELFRTDRWPPGLLDVGDQVAFVPTDHNADLPEERSSWR